ncbi:MAG: PIN domain-containing protein [Betaproteobacteria bacterium]|nr:PIN domain-containing protein [Betaproteobacteria bacterium]
MIKVFLDSNVLISALIGSTRSTPVVLVDWLAGGNFAKLMTGSCCVEEVEKNLERKLPQAQPLWRQFLGTGDIQIVPCTRKSVGGINVKDAGVVSVAISAGASHFVTVDKGLLAEIRAGNPKWPIAVSPREMLEIMLMQG